MATRTKPVSGDPLRIAARDWSDVLDLIDARADVLANPLEHPSRSRDVIRVKNQVGSNLSRWSVVAVGNPVIAVATNLQRFQESLLFDGDSPTSSGDFAILLQPLPTGEIGHAVVSGIVPVQVDVSSEADSAGWDRAHAAAASTDKLVLDSTGSAKVLYRESGTGTKWAMVRLGNDPGAAGITSLGGETGSVQTFSDVDDTNVTLVISSASDNHTFTLGWTGQLAETRGGTAQSTYATGDVLYASGSNTLAKRAIGTAAQVLTVSGGAPVWQDLPATELSEDTSPVLAGDLDVYDGVSSHAITTSESNGDVTLTPNGTGDVVVSSGALLIGTNAVITSAVITSTSEIGAAPRWLQKDYVHDVDFSVASTSTTITLTLPAGSVIQAVYVRVTETVAGGGVGLCQVSVTGNGGSGINYLAGYSLLNTVADTEGEIERPISPTSEVEDHNNNATINIDVDADVNLDMLTAGEFSIWFLVSKVK